MKKLVTAISIYLLSACTGLEPTSTSSSELDLQKNLQFTDSSTELIAATKSSFSDNKWKVLYEGETLPDRNYSTFSNMNYNVFAPSDNNYDQVAIDKALSSDQAPSYYLQAKTPTSAFSYGAEIFVVIYDAKNNGSVASIAASSGQGLEKKKLPGYISQLAEQLNTKAD